MGWEPVRLAGDQPVLSANSSVQEMQRSMEEEQANRVREAEERAAAAELRNSGKMKDQPHRPLIEGDIIFFLDHQGNQTQGIVQTNPMGQQLPPRLVEVAALTDGSLVAALGEQDVRAILQSGTLPQKHPSA